MILGCGDIGQRLALQAALANWRIIGVRRNAPAITGLLAAHQDFSYRQADLTQVNQLQEILPEQLDYLVVTMTPSERTEAGYQTAYVKTAQVLQQALKQRNLAPKRILFISSTSVYGQSDGEAVNEQSPAQPHSYAGKTLLEAEAVYQHSPHPSCVVRFSGIYGPGRFRLIEQALATQPANVTGSPQYSNRLHIEDCAAILQHLLIQCEQGSELEPLYIGTDSEPSDLSAVRHWLREQAEKQLSSLPTLVEPTPSARKTGDYARSSKRLSNERLLSSGYRFIYPSYHQGYQPVLDEYIDQHCPEGKLL